MKRISFILLLLTILIASALLLRLKVFAQTTTAPSNLTAAVLSCSRTRLNWTDNSSDETGFKIKRKDGASGSWTQIGTTAANAAAKPNPPKNNLSFTSCDKHDILTYLRM